MPLLARQLGCAVTPWSGSTLANDFLDLWLSSQCFCCPLSIQLDRGVEIMKIPSPCALLPAQNRSVAPSDIHCWTEGKIQSASGNVSRRYYMTKFVKTAA